MAGVLVAAGGVARGSATMVKRGVASEQGARPDVIGEAGRATSA